MGISGVFRACSAIAFCRFRRKVAFALPLATAKMLEESDRTSLEACSLGASSLAFCRFRCRWSTARISGRLAGAFARLFCRDVFFLVFSLPFSSLCRISDMFNTSQTEKSVPTWDELTNQNRFSLDCLKCVPTWDRFPQTMPHAHSRPRNDTAPQSHRGDRLKVSPCHSPVGSEFCQSHLALLP